MYYQSFLSTAVVIIEYNHFLPHKLLKQIPLFNCRITSVLMFRPFMYCILCSYMNIKMLRMVLRCFFSFFFLHIVLTSSLNLWLCGSFSCLVFWTILTHLWICLIWNSQSPQIDNSFLITAYISVWLHRSLIFGNYFILIRVMVDPEPMSGTLGMRKEYALDVTPVNPMHSHIHNGNLN